MRDVLLNSAYFGIVVSILGYAIGTFINRKLKHPIFNPLLISIILVIGLLLILNIDYDSYNQSAQYLSYLLTPATVCLAVPLYKQLALLKKNIKAVLISITAGVLSSVGSIFGLAKLFSLNHTEYVTLMPKSVTSAIGVAISEELGGISAITISAIVLTGILGNLIAVGICKIFRIKNPIAKGLAIGTASHVIGTTKALEIGEIEGAMSSLAVVAAGLLTVIFSSFFAQFI
jgi:predicted murein hydrolase (TIGR00659 family)